MTNAIAPWLSVRNDMRALDFYRAAFEAAELFRMGDVVDPFGHHGEICRPVDA